MAGDPTVNEVLHKTASKPALSKRIKRSQVDALLEVLVVAGELVLLAPSVFPAISRDRKDDYLLAYSIAGHATHLVTGDLDLLKLEHDFAFQIGTPAELLKVLSQEAPEH